MISTVAEDLVWLNRLDEAKPEIQRMELEHFGVRYYARLVEYHQGRGDHERYLEVAGKCLELVAEPRRERLYQVRYFAIIREKEKARTLVLQEGMRAPFP